MRRLFVLLAGVGLMSAGAGCYHVGGKCDSDPPVQPCCIYGLYPPAFGMPVLPPSPTPPAAPTATQAGAEVPASQTEPTPPPMKEHIGLPREP